MYESLSPFAFIFLRALSGIIPPIPGFMVDIIGIALFGPIFGLLYAEPGVMLGAVVSFFIARKSRDSFLAKKLFLQKIHQWEDKISKNRKFWALVLLRLPTNTIFDYLNYTIGLTKIRFSTFFFSTLIGSLPSMIFFYLFGGWALQQGIYYFALFLVIIVILWLIFRKVYNKKAGTDLLKFEKTL